MSDRKWRKPMKGDDFVESKLVFPYYASFKLDGYRSIVEDGVSRTSSGAPLSNDFAREFLSKPHFEGLDGELIVGAWNDPRAFHNTSGPVRRGSGEPDFRWYIFDDRTRPGDTFTTRLDSVKRRVSLEQSRHTQAIKARIEVIPQKIVSNLTELWEFERVAIAARFEGVMLRKPEGRYKFGRSTVDENLLIKVKRFVTEEAKIVGYEEQLRTPTEEDIEAGHHPLTMIPTGMVGSFAVWSEKWGDFSIQATSLDFKGRKEAFENFTSMYFGEIASFEYFPHGTIDRPRHGIFRGIRGEEDMTA